MFENYKDWAISSQVSFGHKIKGKGSEHRW
jgi:valyl-tRNA synthetase